jgi:hypothetical protein
MTVHFQTYDSFVVKTFYFSLFAEASWDLSLSFDYFISTEIGKIYISSNAYTYN